MQLTEQNREKLTGRIEMWRNLMINSVNFPLTQPTVQATWPTRSFEFSEQKSRKLDCPKLSVSPYLKKKNKISLIYQIAFGIQVLLSFGSFR